MRSKAMALACASFLLASASASADSGQNTGRSSNQDMKSTSSSQSSAKSGDPFAGIVQNPGSYLGQQVTLAGRIDRVIDANTFVLASAQSPAQRVLVFVRNPGANAAGGDQAGAVGHKIKDDQKVNLTGKVDQLRMSSEVDRYNPKKDTATITQSLISAPVVIVQPSDLHLQG